MRNICRIVITNEIIRRSVRTGIFPNRKKAEEICRPYGPHGIFFFPGATKMPGLRPSHKVAKAVEADHLPEDRRPGIFAAFFLSTVGTASL